MALDITGTALADARKSAKDAVRESWLAKNRELTEAEKAQMIYEIDKADSAAILTYLVTNAVVGGLANPGALVVTGVIT